MSLKQTISESVDRAIEKYIPGTVRRLMKRVIAPQSLPQEQRARGLLFVDEFMNLFEAGGPHEFDRVFRYLLGDVLKDVKPEQFDELLRFMFEETLKGVPAETFDKVMVYAKLAAQREELPFGDLQGSYSQEGEDLILDRLFEGRGEGFFVDVGAHHPIKYSNTYLLYLRGWRGINIDAMPGSMEAFRRLRPQDVNLECLVANDAEEKTFHIFNEPALNTASAKAASERKLDETKYRIVRTETLKPRTLASILDEFVPDGTKIDLMNVDVEGLDLDVLRSNDWSRYQPAVIVVELWDADFSEMNKLPLAEFLVGQGYRLTSKFLNSSIFQRRT